MNDFPYDWVPVRMIPRTNDSTLRIYLRSSSVNKLMTWSRTDYLSSLRTDDLFPNRIYIPLTNGWPLSERMTCSQTESLFSVRILRVLTSNKNRQHDDSMMTVWVRKGLNLDQILFERTYELFSDSVVWGEIREYITTNLFSFRPRSLCLCY